MKKIISLALALALCLGLCVPALAVEFSDVPVTHAFYEAISDCSGKGIVGGYSDGTFQPTKTVTRSNFAVMLSRAFYADEVAKYSTGQYQGFMPNYVTLKENGILSGTSWPNSIANTSFMNQGITRFEMATLITNIMNQKGSAASDSEKTAVIPQITDYNSIWSGYQDAVTNVYALGIITGYADGSFNGDGIMNRGQACVVIYRMMQYAGNTSGGEVVTPVPEAPTAPEPATPSTLTLRDGSAVTEENVLKIIDEILKVYPNGTPWDGDTYRDNTVTISGRELGTPSSAITTIRNTYKSHQGGNASMTGGCGGFAGLVSDAIFGGANNGGDKFPIRKLNSVSEVRPGDIILQLNENGLVTHVITAASSVRNTKTTNGVQLYFIWVYDGNNSGIVKYNNYDNQRYVTDDLYKGYSYVAYTRYLD